MRADREISTMSRGARRGTVAMLAAALLLSSTGIAAAVGGPPPHPNVVVVVLDDARTDDVASLPSVQEIAARGTTYSNAFTPFALCAPARASILTGNGPWTHGLRSNDGRLFDPSSTLATWLQGAGYYTGLVGKYLNHAPAGGWPAPPGWSEWHALRKHGDLGNEQSIILGEQAAAFVTSAPEPFMLYAAWVGPHGPLRGPHGCRNVADPLAFTPAPTVPELDLGLALATWTRREERLCGTDRGIRMLLDALAQRNVAERTVVVVIGDNGFMLYEHGEAGKNVLFEPSIRVPFILAGPGIEGGAVKAPLVSLIDVAPTIARLVGIDHPAVDGRAIGGSDPVTKVRIEAQGCTGRRKRDDTKIVSCEGAPTLRYDLVADPWEMNPTETGEETRRR